MPRGNRVVEQLRCNVRPPRQLALPLCRSISSLGSAMLAICCGERGARARALPQGLDEQREFDRLSTFVRKTAAIALALADMRDRFLAEVGRVPSDTPAP